MRLWLALILLVSAVAGHAGAEVPSDINPRLLRRFTPLHTRMEVGPAPSDAMLRLGRMLFYDPRLSLSRDISCNTCHSLDRFGADDKPLSRGHRGQVGRRNAPSVFNAAGQFQQFWDGRASDVEAQALVPILNPTEMAMPNAEALEARLRSIPGYVRAFGTAFPGKDPPLSIVHAASALGAFERGLTTPSRWDRFLAGEHNALSQDEKDGFKVFSNVGCIVCHTGEYLGGSTFQRAGVVEPWPNQQDQGRYELTRSSGDRMVFKVPSLRNVARTGPYFHDGSATDLATAVRMMARHQLGLELGEDEVAVTVKWLESLSGEVDSSYVRKPPLPADGPGSRD